MPDAGLILSPEAMRHRALDTLACLVGGRFGERMRMEAAARIIVTARRVALLAAAGTLAPLPATERPAALITTVAEAWDAAVMTVNEFIETLEPAEIAAILAEAPAWADDVWAQQEGLSEVEKARLLQRA